MQIFLEIPSNSLTTCKKRFHPFLCSKKKRFVSSWGEPTSFENIQSVERIAATYHKPQFSKCLHKWPVLLCSEKHKFSTMA